MQFPVKVQNSYAVVQNDQKPARRCTKVLLDLNSCTRKPLWLDHFVQCIGFCTFTGNCMWRANKYTMSASRLSKGAKASAKPCAVRSVMLSHTMSALKRDTHSKVLSVELWCTCWRVTLQNQKLLKVLDFQAMTFKLRLGIESNRKNRLNRFFQPIFSIRKIYPKGDIGKIACRDIWDQTIVKVNRFGWNFAWGLHLPWAIIWWPLNRIWVSHVN